VANNVEFHDFHLVVEAELNETTIKWLKETGEEIASMAKRNCKMDDDPGKQLKGSYKSNLLEGEGKVNIGTPLEAGYWEEFGTGEYADTAKNGGKPGRQGWWVYTPDEQGPEGYKSHTYYDEMEAMMMAAWIQATYNKKAYISNGRRPAYTLEKSYLATKNGALAELERKLKERMGT